MLLRLHQRREALRDHRLDERTARGSGEHRELLHRGAAPVVEAFEAGQHGLHHARRHSGRRLAGPEHLVHEERVAAGDGVQPLGVGTRGGADGVPELADRVGRERSEREVRRRDSGVAQRQQLVERVLPGEVVAVGQQQQSGQLGDPAHQEPQRVEGGVVDPVDVLDHQHGGVARPRQLVTQGCVELVAIPVTAQHVRQLGAHAGGQVAERAEDTRGDQVVAVPDEQPGVGRQLLAQRVDEGGLADPCLAVDERHAAPPLRGRLHGRGQRGQLTPPLEHLRGHPEMVRRGTAGEASRTGRVGGDRHPLTIRPVRRRRRYGVPLRAHTSPTPDTAILVLEDGRTFTGEAYGARGETFGEAVFSTGMTGYQETLTDPSYHRQVVVMTSPHVGNTGMNDEDPESRKIWVSGYVVRDPARVPSSWRSVRSLDDELREQGVVGISGIDTRALTRHLRERGAMRVGISTDTTDPAALLARVQETAEMAGAELADEVTTTEAYVVPAVGQKRFTVAAVDLGIKANTPRMMSERGIEVHVLPATSSLEDVLSVQPDGLFFSNGPGDPAATTSQVALLQGALEAGLPYFGICFGNQLFGRALGFGTFKLKYGHRGINQPVMDRTTGKVEVTAHNHGFAVDAPLEGSTSTPYGEVTVSHVCLNDDVVEGLELRSPDGALRSFSVQYHPEAAAGPHDAAYLFDRFADLMERNA